MNEENRQKMLALLSDKAANGLTNAELEEIKALESEFPDLAGDESFEIAAAAFAIAGLDTSEQMPAHLQSRILADAEKHFAPAPREAKEEEFQKTFAFEPKRSSVLTWLGWAVAAAACAVLGVNLWMTRAPLPQTAGVQPTPITTPAPTIEQEFQQLLAANDATKVSWTDFDPKKPRGITGDVVWSNSKQKGYIRFHNLPPNDKSKQTYQLWIFEKNPQDQKKPIDGGVFDVDKNGDVIVPINAKLKVVQPAMFGVTVEKPGGVVESELKDVVAVAKVNA
jgi:Anti-sigma-K factor rskA